MADIALRFFKDMLVLSSPISNALKRQGIEDEREEAIALLLEPETVEDVYRVEAAAAPQVMVAPTAELTQARLATLSMENAGQTLADNALAVVRPFKPQHVLVELAPCGLPLDPSSKASLNEHRSQYVRAVELFAGREIDGFLLSGFASSDALKCALMGVRQATDLPVFASVDVQGSGLLAGGRGTLAEAVAVMAEFGAAVVGFRTGAAPDGARELVSLARQGLDQAGIALPMMVTLDVFEKGGRGQEPTADNPYPAPETMLPAALALRAAGVQFLRASGDVTPAYTAVLAAAVTGTDVVEIEGA